MKKTTFQDSGGNQIKKTKRWLGLMAFCVMLFVGQFGFAQAAGSTCDNPLLVSSVPFSDSGNTASYGNNYDLSDVPPTAPGAVTVGTGSEYYLDEGDDVVYSYIAGSNGSISINTTHTGGSGWNSLWVFTGCPFTSTVGYHTATTGTTRSITNLPVIEGQTYYIVISNWDAGAVNFTIDITGTQVGDPPACLQPSNLSVTSLTTNSATLGWASAGDLFDIKWGIAGFDLETEGTLLSGENNPYVLSGLSQSTAYEFYVRQDCDADGVSVWSGPFSFMTTQTPAILDYEEGFEGVHNWILSNGTQTNKWVVGEATNNGGTHAMYISNDNGVTNAYSHTLSVVHAYRDVQIPADADSVLLSFDWKAQGESCCDYLRVWVVPATFTPTPGTLITAANSGGVQFGGNFNMQTNWTNQWYEIPSIDYAGQIVRLVFEWRNDGSIGTAPSGAIDNVDVSVVTCPAPSGLEATDATTTSVELSWASSGTTFDIEYGVAGFTPTGVPTLPGVANNYVLGGLSPATNYQYYVRQDCGVDGESSWEGPFNFSTLCDIITALPYTENFDTYGTGSNGFPNCWERPVTYDNGTVWPSIVAISADSSPNSLRFQSAVGTPTYAVSPAFAEDINNLRVKFNLRREGASSGTIDFGVMSDPFDLTTFELVQTINPTDNVFHEYLFNLDTTTLSGGNNYVAFRHNSNSNIWYYWLDDFVVEILPTCVEPTTLIVTDVTDNSATLGWASAGDLFDIKWGIAGFDLETEGTLVSGENNPYVLSGLSQSTTYEFYVRQDCGAVDGVSVWSGPFTFTTTQLPATLDYEEDFEGIHNWILSNGTQTNKWVVGEATNNGGTHAMYISNDNGVSNAYSHTLSTVHAYRDIQIPADADSILLSFDWKAQGESCCDYLRVWVVPPTFTPTPGTLITAANSGGVQFGGNFNMQTNWTNQWYEVPSIDYAGQIVRLIFEWRNDGSLGTAPAGAIDNVEVSVITCPAPSELAVSDNTTTSVELSWSSTGTSFDIEYGVAGFTPTGVPTVSGVANNYVLGGLSPATNYQYYVRQDCGVDGESSWEGPFNFSTLCDVITALPYTENFDTYGIGSNAFPNCWERPVTYSNGTTWPSIVAVSANSSPNSLRFQSAVGTPTYAVSPAFAEDINNLRVKFNLRREGASSGTIDFGVMSDPFDSSTFELVETINPTDNVFHEYLFNLNTTTLSGSNNYIAFRHNSNSNIWYYWLDDFVVEPIPACLEPSNLGVTNVSDSSADLIWGGIGSLFDVIWGPAGFNPETEGTLVLGTTNPYALSGLTQSTAYDFYVRQDCTANEDGLSVWTGPFTFNTTQIPVALDYEEDFEGIHNWILSNGTQTNKWVVGEATNNGGTHAMYISNDNGVTNAYSHTLSTVHAYRDIQIPADADSVLLSFDWKAQGESCCDYLRVWVVPATFTPTPGTLITAADSGGVQFGGNFNMQTNWTNQWYEIPSIDYAGQIVRLVFEWRNDGSVGTAPSGAIDNVEVSVITCPAPSGLSAGNLTLNSVDISWASNGSAFNIEYGVAGFTLGSGTAVTATSTSHSLTGLTAHTSYEFYVQQDCGVDGVSAWSGPHFFHTGHCVPVSTQTSDYITSFVTTGGLPFDISNTNSGFSAGGYGNFGNMSVSHYETGSVNFTVTNNVGMGINIWIDWNNNLEFEESEKVYASGATGTSFTGTITVPFGVPEGDYRMRVRGQWNNSNPLPCGSITYGEAEDYTFTVITPPDCLPPFTPTATNISASSVLLEWLADGELFDIEYGPVGFTPGDGELITGVGNPYTLAGVTAGVDYDFYVRQDCGEDDGVSMWNGPTTFTPGVYIGDIPSMYNPNPSVGDAACAMPSFSIEVPEGHYLSELSVEYTMISTPMNMAQVAHQRSVLYSPTLEMGESQVVAGDPTYTYPGPHPYDRNIDFALGATGTIEFVLKVWRTEGGTGCNLDYVFVQDGTWILHYDFEAFPTCPIPTDLGYTNITETSVDLIWESEAEGVFDLEWGTIGFTPGEGEAEGTFYEIEDMIQPITGLDSADMYEFYVRSNCSTDDDEDMSDWAGPFKFKSGYCAPISQQSRFITLFSTSEAEENITYTGSTLPAGSVFGYRDRTEFVIVQQAGESFDFQSNYIGGQSGAKIWVDWNQNFVFEDDEEEVYYHGGAAIKSGTITIPEDILPGDYVLRIYYQSGATSVPTACGNVSEGEAIDFTLRIPCEEVAIPTGNTTQTFTTGQTLADLVVSGSNLVWYADADLTIVLEQTHELVHETTYYVVATYGQCVSEALAITVEEVVSTDRFDSASFKAYPNPVRDFFNISYSSDINDVIVINMLGQTVITKTVQATDTQIDMSGLPTGTYFVKVNIEGIIKTIKVTKQ